MCSVIYTSAIQLQFNDYFYIHIQMELALRDITQM